MGEGLTNMLTALGSVFTAFIGHISEIGNTITSTPMLFVPFAVSIVGTIVYMAKRFITRR